jgi:hypothetical protein
MGWLYKLNKAEKFLGLPISKGITEIKAKELLNAIRIKYKIII